MKRALGYQTRNKLAGCAPVAGILVPAEELLAVVHTVLAGLALQTPLIMPDNKRMQPQSTQV